MWKGLKNKCDKVSERMKLAAKNIKKISKKRYKTRLDDLDSYENHSDLNYLNTDKVKKIGFYFVVGFFFFFIKKIYKCTMLFSSFPFI